MIRLKMLFAHFLGALVSQIAIIVPSCSRFLERTLLLSLRPDLKYSLPNIVVYGIFYLKQDVFYHIFIKLYHDPIR